LNSSSSSIHRHCNDPEMVSFLETSEGQTTPTSIPMQQQFQVTCQCTSELQIPANLKLPMEVPYGVCAATEVDIAMMEGGTGLTSQDISTAIGNPLMITWASVLYHHFSDWEGRTSAQVMGLPGGDIGEFINAMDAYEEITLTTSRDSDCERLLRSYLDVTQKISFYMSTDTGAVTQLATAVDIANLDLREPPDASATSKLLDALVLPENQGCGVIKNMLMKPEDFGLRNGLVQCVIQAFFSILWDVSSPESQKLRLVELDGTEAEQAVVIVKTSSECTDQGIAPLVQPNINGNQMFVVHEAAADVYRAELCKFFSTQSEKVSAATMQDIMDASGEKFLNTVIQSLASGLPVFQASII